MIKHEVKQSIQIGYINWMNKQIQAAACMAYTGLNDNYSASDFFFFFPSPSAGDPRAAHALE